jgi:transcriptional regulator with XRE-family HTH domain
MGGDMTKLGTLIAKARAKHGMSYRDVSRVCGLSVMSQTTVFDLENGKNVNPKISTLFVLGFALGISPITLAKAAIEDLEK